MADAKFDFVRAAGGLAPLHKVLVTNDGWSSFWEVPFETTLDEADKKTYHIVCKIPITNICLLSKSNTWCGMRNLVLKIA